MLQIKDLKAKIDNTKANTEFINRSIYTDKDIVALKQ